MRTLVYKRTHPGDPDEDGVFGCEGCMGQVRGFDFEAVIGIGGMGKQAKSHGIDGRLNWIGIGPHEVGEWSGYPQLGFEHFRLWEHKGDLLKDVAPALAKRFCRRKALRYALYDFSDKELEEIARLLARVRNAPPSPGLLNPGKRAPTGKCPPKHKRKC